MSWLAIISKLQENVLEMSLCWTLSLGDLWFGFFFFPQNCVTFLQEKWNGVRCGKVVPLVLLSRSSWACFLGTSLGTRGECTEFALVFSLWVEQNEPWKLKVCKITMGGGDWCHSFWCLCLLFFFFFNKNVKGLFLKLKTQKFEYLLVY